MRVHREGRAEDDGYRSALLPGLRASRDALALAEEIAFAHGRLLALQEAPPGLYGEVRALAERDIEQATWACFLIAYFSPLDGEDPFAGIRMALAATSGGEAYEGGVLGDLDQIPLGPRSSHDPARAASTLLAYRQWAERAGSQAQAFEGDPAWSPQRRFERCFERLALPGFPRMGRYDLLVTLGRLGLYEMCADSLHFISANEPPSGDLTTLAAKRVFAIGDPLNLERRAQALAGAISVSVETLDLALWNWSPPAPGARATLGVRSETCDLQALERTRAALEL
jgi:Alpha-glutamyl/putrescinyl thymine pyrophosphorylase clade 3